MDTITNLTDEQLADALRERMVDGLLSGECVDVEDFLSWVRSIVTGHYRPLESVALPYLEFDYDLVGSLDFDEARKFIGREVVVVWQAFGSLMPRFVTLDGAFVTGVEREDRDEFIVVRDRDGEEMVPLARVTNLRTIDVRRREISS